MHRICVAIWETGEWPQKWTISTNIRLMKALVWPVATYGCGSCRTLRKNKETRPDAFEMKGLRKILRVSWTAKKTNRWVLLNKAGVKRELLDTVKARKLAYYGHTTRKQGSCLEKKDNARNNARSCTQARKTTRGLNGQHQYVDRTPRGRVNRTKINGESNPWSGQFSDRGRLKNRTDYLQHVYT